MAQTDLLSNTIFYIRTNDNNDDTANILRDWYCRWNWKWKMVFDDSSIDVSLIDIENHDWNARQFKILGKIRQDSINFAISENADYFVADVDNIIKPNTLSAIRSVNLPVVAPLLVCPRETSLYANYHSSVDENGYFKNDDEYLKIRYQSIKGLIQIPVVHCTYHIQNFVLPYVSYDDDSYRYEYVIFSDSLRKAGIAQFLDNREIYGFTSFSSTQEDLQAEMAYLPFAKMVEYINKTIPSEWKIR
jgi:hypothetical protein